jgi:putative addiction module antidote
MFKLKVTTIGHSTRIILPRDVLERLKVREGDFLLFTNALGGFRITPYNPGFELQMKLARKAMREGRSMLRLLAKS